MNRGRAHCTVRFTQMLRLCELPVTEAGMEKLRPALVIDGGGDSTADYCGAVVELLWDFIADDVEGK